MPEKIARPDRVAGGPAPARSAREPIPSAGHFGIAPRFYSISGGPS